MRKPKEDKQEVVMERRGFGGKLVPVVEPAPDEQDDKPETDEEEEG